MEAEFFGNPNGTVYVRTEDGRLFLRDIGYGAKEWTEKKEISKLTMLIKYGPQVYPDRKPPRKFYWALYPWYLGKKIVGDTIDWFEARGEFIVGTFVCAVIAVFILGIIFMACHEMSQPPPDANLPTTINFVVGDTTVARYELKTNEGHIRGKPYVIDLPHPEKDDGQNKPRR